MGSPRRKKRRKKPFPVVLVVTLLILVPALGVGGYFVYKTVSKPRPTPSADQPKNDSPPGDAGSSAARPRTDTPDQPKNDSPPGTPPKDPSQPAPKYSGSFTYRSEPADPTSTYAANLKFTGEMETLYGAMLREGIIPDHAPVFVKESGSISGQVSSANEKTAIVLLDQHRMYLVADFLTKRNDPHRFAAALCQKAEANRVWGDYFLYFDGAGMHFFIKGYQMAAEVRGKSTDSGVRYDSIASTVDGTGVMKTYRYTASGPRVLVETVKNP